MGHSSATQCLLCPKELPSKKGKFSSKIKVDAAKRPEDETNDKVAFLLLHLLELPVHKLSQFRLKCDDPEKWIRLCGKCSKEVEFLKGTSKEIQKLFRRFWRGKRRLIETCITCLDKSGDNSGSRSSDDDFQVDITGECREFIRTHIYERPPHLFEWNGGKDENVLQNPRLTSSIIPTPISRNKDNHPHHGVAMTVKSELSLQPELPSSSQLSRGTKSNQRNLDTKSRRKRSNSKPIQAVPTTADTTATETFTIYKCPNCPRIFTHFPSYRKHLRLHDSTKYLKCRLCSKPFFFQGFLHLHEKRCSGIDSKPSGHLWKCQFCRKPFSTIKLLIQHKKEANHLNRKDGKGNENMKIFTHARSFLVHHGTHANRNSEENREKKNKEHTLSCGNCSQVFEADIYCRAREKLRQHLASAHGEGEFKCDRCSKLFGTRSFLTGHQRYCKVGQPRQPKPPKTPSPPQVCPFCAKQLKTPRNLQAHMAKLHNYKKQLSSTRKVPNKVVSTCPKCSETFESKTELNLHLHEVHQEQVRLAPTVTKCDLCGENLAGKKRLKQHMVTVHGVGEKCTFPQCDEVLANEFQLKKHLKTVHNSKLPERFMCTNCGRKFRRVDRLRDHERRKHSKDSKGRLKPFKCDLCDCGYNTHVEFRRHQREKHGIYKKTPTSRGKRKTQGTSKPRGNQKNEIPDVCVIIETNTN